MDSTTSLELIMWSPHSWYLGLSEDGRNTFRASLGPTVAILTFAAAQFVQIYTNFRVRRRAKRRTIIGIYREIAENIRDLEQFATVENIDVRIKDRIAEDHELSIRNSVLPSYRPLIAITESSDFFDKSYIDLPGLKRDCMLKVAAYYRSVRDQRMIVDSIDKDAFLRISMEQRQSTIDDLWSTFSESTSRGNSALDILEQYYRKRWFKGLRP